jgi:hypothetical protein
MLQQDYDQYVSEMHPKNWLGVNLHADKSGYESERYQDGDVER